MILSSAETSHGHGLQLSKSVDDMTTVLDARGSSSTSAMSHTLTRHREIVSDYTRDFKRTQSQIRESEKRQNLLGSVREEISNFKQGQGQNDSDMLLAERGRIDNSHRMTDEVLEQAYATRYEFSQQRSALGQVNTRMKGVMSESLVRQDKPSYSLYDMLVQHKYQASTR